MSEKEKLKSGEIYDPNDSSIFDEQLLFLNKLYDFNQTRPTELKKREQMLKEMFAESARGAILNHRYTQIWAGITSTLATLFTQTLT